MKTIGQIINKDTYNTIHKILYAKINSLNIRLSALFT